VLREDLSSACGRVHQVFPVQDKDAHRARSYGKVTSERLQCADRVLAVSFEAHVGAGNRRGSDGARGRRKGQ
jgi:hypothetical protein